MKRTSLTCLVFMLLLALAGCDRSYPLSPTLPSATPRALNTSSAHLRTDVAQPIAPSSTPILATKIPITRLNATSATLTTSTGTPVPVTLTDFASAMRTTSRQDVIENATLPHYALRMTLDPRRHELVGTEQIDFTNRGEAPLNDVALRLYPNFPRDVFGRGGDTHMAVTEAFIAGQEVQVQYAAHDTVVLLPFAKPLDLGQAATLIVSFTATVRPAIDGTWPLPSFYPMLAIRDGDTWRLDVTRFADRVYAESALYTATITVPSTLTVVASGNTVASHPNGDDSTTYFVSTGPVREFALTVGRFSVAHETAGDVDINVYTARGSTLDATQIAQVAAAALAVFDRRFGPYPYRKLDIHLLPGPHDGGDEYPGLILLTSDRQVDEGTRYVTAHEVAHQWWYGVVGNDIYREPWLDEAFAQYSGIVYDQDVAGAAVTVTDWNREVLRRYHRALADGDLPIGLGIADYRDFNVYYHTVYGKGAIFLRTLREMLGDQMFFKGLQNYYQQHRYRVATTEDVQRAFEDASQQDLSEIFRRWVTGE